MLKFIHTSDWHLGHMLYNHDRTEEQSSMLEQIKEIVAKEKPDALLVCGDIYHTPQPSSSVQKLLVEKLYEIHEAHPEMIIVVTAGNHDSGTRHEVHNLPWLKHNVHLIGNLDKENLENHIIEIPGKGYIAAIPYTHRYNSTEEQFQSILDLIKERNTRELPIVMTAHTTVSGCDITGHIEAENLEREKLENPEDVEKQNSKTSHNYTVGGIDSYNIEEMGKGYDYLALGHIHHAQWIGKEHKARYSGTPLAISFDENYKHTLSIVEIEKHGEKPRLKELDIINIHPLVTLPINGFEQWEDVKKMFNSYPGDIPSYIRLNVAIDDFIPPDANAIATKIAAEKACKFCYINAKRKEKKKTGKHGMTIQEFKQEAPIEIARRYASDIGVTFDDEMESMFKEIEHIVNEDSRK